MPKTSEKTKIVDFLIQNAVNAIKWIDDEDSDEEEVDNILRELRRNILVVYSNRRGINHIVPKSCDWRNNILTQLDDSRFTQMMRVNRNQFNHLVSLISKDLTFQKPHACKQFSVELQLAIVLYRLGSSGESASIRKTAAIFGVGDGETLMKITKRIFGVFLKLLPKYIFWPSSSERAQIINDTYNELPLCIGYIDGTEIKIAETPLINHETYFSRNHIYSIKLQVVCDYKLRIRDVVVGYPGSTHDAKIFSNSSLLLQKDRFFLNQSWIAGDSAYPLSDVVITPYRSNSQQLTSAKRIEFNKRHSQYRVRVEHCFGILKEKFCSLKELRIRIKNDDSHKLCSEWIIVCCILHNILLIENETENFQEIPISTDEYTDADILVSNDDANSFESKRQSIYNLMFN